MQNYHCSIYGTYDRAIIVDGGKIVFVYEIFCKQTLFDFLKLSLKNFPDCSKLQSRIWTKSCVQVIFRPESYL